MGTNLLMMTEEQFWNSSPKKLQALFKVYKAVNGVDEPSEFDTIDCILL